MHFGASAFRVGAATILAWAVAFPLGVLLGFFPRLDRTLAPTIFMTYPIPKIVLLPLFLMFFGLGNVPKILMIALILSYQILVAARDGVLNLDKKYLDSFHSLGGGNWGALCHVAIPAALPGAFTAQRIGCGTGIAVLFFVESFATNLGLGYYIMDSWGRADAPRMFSGMIGMSLLGLFLYETTNYLEKTVCAWKHLEAGRRPVGLDGGGKGSLMAGILTYGRMIKFSHTIFALPFALAAVILAELEHDLTGSTFFWILVAMVGARSSAMGFNRIVDADIDALNPRTSGRALPAGVLSRRAAWLFVGTFSLLFVVAAAMISRTCLFFSIPVLMVLFSYSYTKRFTSFSHLYLGFCISLAPIGAWIAVTGGFDWRVLLLALALMSYIAGFDILYACQDEDFDRKLGLFSIPARWGTRAAFHFSAFLHVLSFIFFLLILIVFDLGPVYLTALIIIGLLLVAEHRLVRPDDLNRIQMAFFHVNGAISVVLLLGILGDYLMR